MAVHHLIWILESITYELYPIIDQGMMIAISVFELTRTLFIAYLSFSQFIGMAMIRLIQAIIDPIIVEYKLACFWYLKFDVGTNLR